MSEISNNTNFQTIDNIYANNMQSTNLTQLKNNVIKPKSKRHQAYDMVKERYIYYTNPYGRTAKRLYKQYIGIGHDAEMVMPNDLKYYPDSGRFRRFDPASTKINYGKMDVKERSSFKRYLATYSVSNKTNISAFAGLDLIKQFIPKLKSMLNLHKGIKFYFDVQCHMVKYLDGEVLTEDKDRWVGSTLVSVNDISDLNTKLKSSKGVLKQKIINQEAHNGSMWVFKKSSKSTYM